MDEEGADHTKQAVNWEVILAAELQSHQQALQVQKAELTTLRNEVQGLRAVVESQNEVLAEETAKTIKLSVERDELYAGIKTLEMAGDTLEVIRLREQDALEGFRLKISDIAQVYCLKQELKEQWKQCVVLTCQEMLSDSLLGEKRRR